MDILFTLNYYETDYIFYRYAANLFKNYRKALRRITLNYIRANDSYLIFVNTRVWENLHVYIFTKSVRAQTRMNIYM